jgi:nudix-type nucleoside diphosphatase (YffH/AdpP family)
MTTTIIDARTVHDGFTCYRVFRMRTPDGQVILREVEDHGPAVAVLPYDPERRVALMVSQMRPPLLVAGGPETLTEAPAGLLEEGEDPAACAAREALEEAGVALRTLEPVGTAYSMPGLSTEKIHMFLAAFTMADRVTPGGGLPEEHEDIAVSEVLLADLAAQADAGTLADMKTLALVQTLRLRHPELFTG